jgi:hypothetical protein
MSSREQGLEVKKCLKISNTILLVGVEHHVFEVELMGMDADLRLFGQMGSLMRGRRLRFALILKGSNIMPCTFKQCLLYPETQK